MDIAGWLQALGLERYGPAFLANDVSPELLPNLTADDLKDLGITSVGHRRQLLQAIAALRPGTDAPAEPARMPGQPGVDETSAELRPLSVLFCDLIGSAALSSRLDPEDLQDVFRAYQASVAATIRHFDGFIARYVGDGVLIYFGWPEARETDAERAVRAALAVAAAVSAVPVGGEKLHVRIGIATGLVLIGAIGSGGSHQQAAIGDAPNLAARLQALAGPNQVVIDAATRRQIGGLFACRDLGPVELKGLSTPVPAWQVLAENRAIGQFEALRSGATPLVGREEDMDLLLRRWEQAKSGDGRVVLISAEPGVGKSRLAAALATRIAGESHLRLSYFCSPHHQDSALYPVIAQMERVAGLGQADEPALKRGKLQALLDAIATPPEEVALMLDLHGLPSADIAAPLDVTPQRKQDKIFEAMLAQLERLARQQPLLILFDDIHWIDPSSRELLDRFVERAADWPVLLVAMFRPEFQPPWTGQPHVTALTLARLDRRKTRAMVASVAGPAALPPDLVAEIAERTDGVPLFVEELTKAVLEAGAHASAGLSAAHTPAALSSAHGSAAWPSAQGSAASSSAPHPGLAVPATLHASLMARLDRLGPTAKEVAQTGAAIGREFDYGLLASTTVLTELQLREALARLTQAALLFVRGTPPQASYIFKHALVQDAAYGSLLRSRRQRLHARIATALEDRFPEVAASQPAVLAQHCAAAGLADKAVTYRLAAGQQAASRSAMTEAVAQLRKGLDVLGDLTDGPGRRQQELALQATLASALTATKGWSGQDVGETLSRARALAEQLDRPEYLVPLIVGQFALHYVRAEYRPALALGEQLETIGAARNEPAAQMLSGFTRGVTRYFLGEFAVARAVLETCLRLADPAHLTITALSFDPYAATRAYLALTLACQGYINQAKSQMDQALAAARRIGHAHTLVYLLVHKTWLDWLTRSPLLHLEECSALITEQGFPYYLGWMLAYRGRSLITLGRAEEAVSMLSQALSEMRRTGSVTNTPMPLTWLAQAHAMLGQAGEERACLAEAARIIESTEERLFAAELLHRVPGDLLEAAGDRSAAERHYREAICVAERQGAKLFQLRAAVSLARLWRAGGRHAKATGLLGPVYDSFTEGFDAPDLQEAKALLDELHKLS